MAPGFPRFPLLVARRHGHASESEVTWAPLVCVWGLGFVSSGPGFKSLGHVFQTLYHGHLRLFFFSGSWFIMYDDYIIRSLPGGL